jgi:hypothetical protein
MGLLSACMGIQPLGTLWLGMLATGIEVAPAIAASSLIALLTIARRPCRSRGAAGDRTTETTAREAQAAPRGRVIATKAMRAESPTSRSAVAVT